MAVAERLDPHNPEHTRKVTVDAAKFVELLISHRPMTRIDTPGSGLYGLIDREEGVLYTASESELHRKPR